MAYFFPSRGTETLVFEALEFMLLHALGDSKEPLTLGETLEKVGHMFGLNFDDYECVARLNKLVEHKKVAHSKQTYALTRDARERLEAQVRKSTDLEARVIADWLKGVVNANPNLSEADAKGLRSDLELYVALVYRYHGVDCVRAITGDDFQRELEKASDETLGKLPHRSKRVAKIRAVALPSFVLEASDSDRRDYLLGLLNSSFILTIMSADRSVLECWMKSWRGARFYLDTNFLVWLLNVSGSFQFEIAKRVAELARQTTAKLVASRASLVELYSVLEPWGLRLSPSVTQEQARRHQEAAQRQGILRAFFEHVALGYAAEDFLARFQDVEGQLADYGIEIDETDLRHLYGDDPDVKDYVRLLRADPTYKSYDLALHDALLCHRVRKLRAHGMTEETPHSKVWLLTCDNSLVDCELGALGSHELPATIHVAAWLQLARPMMGRTAKDWDIVFVSVVRSAHLRAFSGLTEQSAEVFSRRGRSWERYDPAMAMSRMLQQWVLYVTKAAAAKDGNASSGSQQVLDDYLASVDKLEGRLIQLENESEDSIGELLRANSKSERENAVLRGTVVTIIAAAGLSAVLLMDWGVASSIIKVATVATLAVVGVVCSLVMKPTLSLLEQPYRGAVSLVGTALLIFSVGCVAAWPPFFNLVGALSLSATLFWIGITPRRTRDRFRRKRRSARQNPL